MNFMIQVLMIQFSATIEKFASQGEKTGWSYIKIPALLSEKILTGCKKSYRVKGRLDGLEIKGMALIPMGGGDFIMALKKDIRNVLKKQKGDAVQVILEVDQTPYEVTKDLTESLQDDHSAFAFFKTLPVSHQNYFSKWIESAKTETTRIKRIAQTINALSKNAGYSEMIRMLKEEKKLLGK